MPDNELAIYVRKEYVCGNCQYSMSINWDNKTVACINANCDSSGINLILKPTMLRVRNNGKDSNTSKTTHR